MKPLPRCINLDWLEVAALEPIDEPHDADFFRACGCVVIEREYGTRVWAQMFTIEGEDHLPFMEVRRCPKSDIIEPNIVHLRLVNRACYFPHAASIMAGFLEEYRYDFHHICRVDVCSDFEKFDYGDDPKAFMRRFMEGKYSKINQANIHAHGSDDWAGRVWNSLSWGAPSSDVGTKFYNKTLELYDPVTQHYAKPYIRQAWQVAGLVDDATTMQKRGTDGELYTPDIWRVEFSIRSSVRNWFVVQLHGEQKNLQSIRNTLDMYDTDEKLLIMFASLSEHYFHFKHLIKRYDFYREGKSNGYAIRKDRCPDKLLFNWQAEQTIIKVAKQHVATSDRPSHELMTLLNRLKAYRETTLDVSVRQSCDVIINHLSNYIANHDQSNPLTRADIAALRQALRLHMTHPTIDPALLIKMAREDMKLRSEITPVF